MKAIFYIFILTFLALPLGIAHAGLPGLPFMTVEDYVEAHPEQAALMTNFEALVQANGKIIQIPQPTPVKITFIYPGNQISDYWRRSIQSFKRRMDEIGLSYELTDFFSKPAEDYTLQETQLKEAMRGNPDYIVFTLDAFKHKSFIENTMRASGTKLILQNITTPLREWEGRQPFMYVGFDHSIGARILADYYINRTDGVGGYGLLYFTRGYVSTMRGGMFEEYVKANSRLQLKHAAYTDGNAEKSAIAAERMLQDADIKFLYACTTDIAIGAIKAIKKSGMAGQVLINGWGGGSRELEAIMAGELDVTVMRMNDDNGVAMAEAIRLDVEGKGDLVPTIFSGDMVLVEKGISKGDLDKLIARAFRYSNK